MHRLLMFQIEEELRSRQDKNQEQESPFNNKKSQS